MSDSVLLTHLKAATMVDTASGYGLIKDAGIALEQGQIVGLDRYTTALLKLQNCRRMTVVVASSHRP